MFNDAPYIGKCLDSVCSQTIAEDLEIIIVDDGSTDGSADVARKAVEEHSMLPQTKFIVLETNKGVANARKLAIEAATGDYIMSCDGDDWMDVTMCEKLLNVAQKDNCDVVVCDYNKVLDGVVTPIGPCYREPFLSQLLLCSVTGSLCNKLISSEILKLPGFVYPTHDFSEDYVYCIQVALLANRIGYVPESLYYYLKREDSLVRSQNPESCIKRGRDDDANYRQVLSILDNANLSLIYREELIYHKLRRKNQYKANPPQWRRTYPELNREIFQSRFVSFRARVVYFLTYCGWFGKRSFHSTIERRYKCDGRYNNT